MPCSITFTISDNGKFLTRVKWGDKEKPSNVNKFRKMLKNIQSGYHNIDICEAVISTSEKNLDRKTAKRILKAIAERKTNMPVIFPQELGQELND